MAGRIGLEGKAMVERTATGQVESGVASALSKETSVLKEIQAGNSRDAGLILAHLSELGARRGCSWAG